MVKADLEDFDIPADLDLIKLKSADSFKNMVKVKSKEFAWKKFMRAKIDHSKLDNLWYSDLNIQKYLTASKFTAEEARMLFLFRTRMARFEENFRNGKEHIICPLCQLHYDSQNLAFQCPIVNANIKVNGKYEDLF